MNINDKQLYNENKTLNLEFFNIYKDLAILLSKTYFEKTKVEKLDSYKLKHLIDESFSLLEFISLFANEDMNYDEFLEKIKNHKHSEDVSDDDIETLNFDDFDKKDD